MEGFYYYSFFLTEVCFGVIWLWDFVVTLRNPLMLTGKYLLYQCVCAYFCAMGFSICLYF